MIQLTFPLDIHMNSPRPVFTALVNGRLIDCMLDTGADMSVFCKGAELFEEFIKGMNVIKFKESSLGGFEISRESTTLWK